MYRIFYALALLLAVPSYASLPEIEDIGVIDLTAAEVDSVGGTDVPNQLAVIKALREFGIDEPIIQHTHLPHQNRDVYDTPSFQAVVSSSSDANRLLAIRDEARERPFVGLQPIFPRLILRPFSVEAELGSDPAHIFISDRQEATMRDVVLGAVVRDNQDDWAMVYSLGHRLGQFQQASVRQLSNGILLADAHLNLQCEGIVPVRRYAFGRLGEFGFTDCLQLYRGAYAAARPIAVDPMYYLHTSVAMLMQDEGFSALSRDKQQANIKGYISAFFRGYILAFPSERYQSLRNIFTTDTCMTMLAEHAEYPVPMLPVEGDYARFPNEFIFPVVIEVFEFLAGTGPYRAPAYMPASMKLDVMEQIQRRLPADFNAEWVKATYPRLMQTAPQHMMGANRYAAYLYVTCIAPCLANRV